MSEDDSTDSNTLPPSSEHHHDRRTDLPIRQMSVLCFCCFCEQVAFNSTPSYTYFMVERFGIAHRKADIGFYLGLITTSFLACQSLTNPFWGWTSDRIGRKPVVLIGTLGTLLGFLLFGFAKSYAWAIVSQVLMGALNANQGIISTIFGELSNSSNQSIAFSLMPIFWGLGAVIGPVIGGALVFPDQRFPSLFGGSELLKRFPFLLPNLLSAMLLGLDFLLVLLFLKESHERGTGRRIEVATYRFWDKLIKLWRFAVGTSSPPNSPRLERQPLLRNRSSLASITNVPVSTLLTPNILLIVGTFGLFSLCMVAYNQLFPIFLSSDQPVGRGMFPEEIGYALGGAALASIAMQAVLFTSIERAFGFTWCYRAALIGFSTAFFLTPFVGLTGGRVDLWFQIVGVLIVKTLASVLGLTCAMLLITNSAPSKDTLGALNGLSQGFAAFSRAFAPFISGFLWSEFAGNDDDSSPRNWPVGPFLTWNVFGILCIIAFVGSIWIRKPKKIDTDDAEDIEASID